MVFIALLALVPLMGLGLAWAMLGEPYRPVFKRHPIQLPLGWPKLSIVHISDLHVRRGDLRLFRAQKAALKAIARPDLLCVTGDVCEKIEDIHLVVDLLQSVKPRLGTFVVLGNHEHNAPMPPGLRDQHKRGWRKA